MSTERYEPAAPLRGSQTAPQPRESDMASRAEHLKDRAQEQASDALEQAKAKGGELQENVQHAAGQGVDKAASAAEGLAGTLREKADQLPGDRTTELAYQAAGGLERGAEYLRDADLNNMRGDLETMIRKYPVQSIAVGLAAGFLLARVFR
jgi:ElaB/YqjD/DUF883 family membrane-anchored ribosome-binding protein